MKKLVRSFVRLYLKTATDNWTIREFCCMRYREPEEKTLEFSSLSEVKDFLRNHTTFYLQDFKRFKKTKYRIYRGMNDSSSPWFTEENFISFTAVYYDEGIDSSFFTFQRLMEELKVDDFIAYCKDNGLTVCPLK